VEIVHGFGISDLIIGLTIVGVGTSLPELASSELFNRDMRVMAALTLSLFVIGYGFRGPGRINRCEGSLLLACHVSYTTCLVSTVFVPSTIHLFNSPLGTEQSSENPDAGIFDPGVTTDGNLSSVHSLDWTGGRLATNRLQKLVSLAFRSRSMVGRQPPRFLLSRSPAPAEDSRAARICLRCRW
jgi:Sodium/calcium exchanger protein